MDPVRVLSPSISFAAHAAGASLLLLAPLVWPEAPPRPTMPRFGGGVHVAPVPVSLGVPSSSGSALVRPRPVRPTSTFRAPSVVAPLAPEPTLDLEGIGLHGLSEDLAGGPGLCLFDCGTPDPQGGTVLPDARDEKAPIRLRKGGGLREPRKLRHVRPIYPPLALEARVQGPVVLECVIGEDGRVSEVAVRSGHPLLDSAAIDAVRQWTYTPTLLNGVRVSVVLTVTVDFRLR
jgi:protein TonB